MAQEKPQPQRKAGYRNEILDEAEVLARELDNPARGPNPVPGKKVDNMTIEEEEKMERWLGILPSSEERWRRERIRRLEKEGRR